MDIEIRRAEPEDAEALKVLYSYPEAISELLQIPFPTKRMWQDRLSNERNGVYSLVALVNGQVAAHCGLFQEQRERRRHCAGIGIIVSPGYQRQGVGSALVAAVLDLADNWLNISRIELTVYTDNIKAQSLYKKFGFKEEGIAKNYAFRYGKYADVLSMARCLPLG